MPPKKGSGPETGSALQEDQDHYTKHDWGKDFKPDLIGERVRLHLPGYGGKYENQEGVVQDHEAIQVPEGDDPHHLGDSIVTVKVTTGDGAGDTLRLHNLAHNFTVIKKK